MNNGYIPKPPYAPTMESILRQYGIYKKSLFSKNEIMVLNRRALVWLENAATHAYATLNTAIHFYPKEHKPYITQVLDALSLILNDARKNLIENPQEKPLAYEALNKKLLDAREVIARANTTLNNSVLLLPMEIQKAILEARDVCYEAILQPCLFHLP